MTRPSLLLIEFWHWILPILEFIRVWGLPTNKKASTTKPSNFSKSQFETMSIRSLTLRLAEEATEARKRNSYTPGVGASSPAALPPRKLQAAFLGGRKHLHSVPSSPDPLSPKQQTQPSLRSQAREVDTRWQPPGGIAARFGLHTSSPPEATTSLGTGVSVVSQSSTNGNGDPGPTTAASGAEDAEKANKTTPITIELQSH